MNLDLAFRMYAEGYGLADAATAAGMSMSTLRRRLLAAGKMRGVAEAVRVAGERGNLTGRKTRGATRDRQAFRERYRVTRQANAKGRSLKPNGYVDITIGEHAGRSEHRVIMESHLGRPLRSDEVVHHRNHNRSDNRLENLEVMTRAEHSAHHAIEKLPGRARTEKGQFA